MLVELDIPSGVFANGTLNQSKGRWRLTNYVRFNEGAILPVGGWSQRSASLVTGVSRAVITWVTNSIARYIGIGCPSKLYVMNRAGGLFDITPVGLSPGRTDAVAGGGYGSGSYGVGSYGTPRAANGAVLPATVWSLDTWGQDLAACNADDGKLYEWMLNTATPAAEIANAPEDNQALLVTDEGFMLALAAGGDPRKVQWSDQRDNTSWTPSSTNQAGDYDLQTMGQLRCGRKTNGAHLLFTDLDVHLGTYIGTPYVYSYTRLADGCGIVSQAAAISAGDAVFWMSAEGFWVFNGAVSTIDCDVWDYVFNNLNTLQKSKIYTEHNAQFGEVKWCYPSASSTEINSAVIYNYRQQIWYVSQENRTAGVGAGVYEYPIRVSAAGAIYEHEKGPLPAEVTAYLESGPMEVGAGENVITVLGLMPDEATAGDCTASFYGRMFPNGAETVFGPYDLTNKNSQGQVCMRFTTRQLRIRFTGAQMDSWRIGPPKINIAQRGLR